METIFAIAVVAVVLIFGLNLLYQLWLMRQERAESQAAAQWRQGHLVHVVTPYHEYDVWYDGTRLDA